MISLTKARKIIEQIDAAPNKVQDIINESEYGICITDEKGNFRFVSDRYTEIYGYGRNELIGNSFTMIVPTQDKGYLQDLHDKFISEGAEISRVWEVQGKGGKAIKIFADALFTSSLDGRPHKVTFVELHN
ncbi:MAG: PAS domain-containing protein [Bernardetiaceae bacterium]